MKSLPKNKKNVGLIKIDTEGAERLVVEGGFEVFKKSKPTLIYEQLSEDSVISNLLSTLGYCTFVIDDVGFKLIPVDDFSLKIGKNLRNRISIHRSKIKNIEQFI